MIRRMACRTLTKLRGTTTPLKRWTPLKRNDGIVSLFRNAFANADRCSQHFHRRRISTEAVHVSSDAGAPPIAIVLAALVGLSLTLWTYKVRSVPTHTWLITMAETVCRWVK
jgi:hypothetical protein